MREGDYPQGRQPHLDHHGKEYSTIGGLWAREGTRILLLVIGVLGAFAWNRLNSDVAAVKMVQAQMQLTIQATDMKVGTLTTRLDEGVIRQVNANAAAIQDHEARIRAVERATRH